MPPKQIPTNPSTNTDHIPPDLKPRLAASYNAIAPTYNSRFTTPSDPIRLDYLARLHTLLQLPAPQAAALPSARVLELGCGAGIPATKFLLDMASPPCHVTANDMSGTQLALARSNLSAYAERVEYVEADMNALSFPERSFDAVVACYSIIHLPRGEQTALVQKLATWLKPGGYLVANFTEEEAGALEEETWLGEEKGWMFWSGWGAEGSVKVVGEAGLEVLVKEVRQSANDAKFMWVIARREGGGGEGQGEVGG